MNTYKLVDLKNIESNIVTSETNLSICLTASGFYFSLIDNNYILKCLGEFEADLNGGITQIMMTIKECFKSIGIHIFNFNRTRIVCQTSKNVWIPYRLYDATKNRDYLSTTNSIHSSETIIANTSEKLEVVMPKAKFITPSYVLAEYAFDIASLKNNTMILYKRNNACDFAVFKGNEFTLSNSFSYSSPEDMIYFILNTLQQTGINSGEVCLLITGEDYSERELSLLQKFVQEVSYANVKENIIVDKEFDCMSLQKYFMVLA